MSIIDYECLACASFSGCGTEIGKGSIMCAVRRTQNRQTKGERVRDKKTDRRDRDRQTETKIDRQKQTKSVRDKDKKRD